MPKDLPAIRLLDTLFIPYRLFVHKHFPASLEEAARERGQEPGQVVRSILFRAGEGTYFLILVAGPRQISWVALRSHLGIRRISLATEEQVLRVTGYEIGTVSPLGLKSPVRILVDEGVFRQGEISFGGGRLGMAIIMEASDLLRVLGEVECGQFC